MISNHCCIYTTLEGHDPIFTHNFCCSKSKSVEKTPKPQKQRVFFFRLLHFSFLRIYRTRLQRRQWQSPMQEWMDGHFWVTLVNWWRYVLVFFTFGMVLVQLHSGLCGVLRNMCIHICLFSTYLYTSNIFKNILFLLHAFLFPCIYCIFTCIHTYIYWQYHDV